MKLVVRRPELVGAGNRGAAIRWLVDDDRRQPRHGTDARVTDQGAGAAHGIDLKEEALIGSRPSGVEVAVQPELQTSRLDAR